MPCQKLGNKGQDYVFVNIIKSSHLVAASNFHCKAVIFSIECDLNVTIVDSQRHLDKCLRHQIFLLF